MALSLPSTERGLRPRDNPALAALCACIAVLSASIMDAGMKGMSARYPVHELMVLRALAAVPFLTFLAWREAGPAMLRPPRYPMIVLRSTVMCSAYASYVMAVAAMPLADTAAIYFTMPLFVAALAGVTLGERVPLHRIVTILIGFAGTTLRLRPGGDVFEPAAFLALYSAFGYAVGQLLARSLGAQVTPGVLAFHQNIIYLVIALLMAILLSGSSHVLSAAHPSIAFLTRPWASLQPLDLAFVLIMGPLVTSSMYFFSLAYRIGQASFVAPFEYSAIIWAAIFGLVLWGDIPSPMVLVGAAVVAMAGIYMLRRDARQRGLERSPREPELNLPPTTRKR
jgi:drug/metabolite transporter (DMT)-like permease